VQGETGKGLSRINILVVGLYLSSRALSLFFIAALPGVLRSVRED
jgi:hypothetical protein